MEVLQLCIFFLELNIIHEKMIISFCGFIWCFKLTYVENNIMHLFQKSVKLSSKSIQYVSFKYNKMIQGCLLSWYFVLKIFQIDNSLLLSTIYGFRYSANSNSLTSSYGEFSLYGNYSLYGLESQKGNIFDRYQNRVYFVKKVQLKEKMIVGFF